MKIQKIYFSLSSHWSHGNNSSGLLSHNMILLVLTCLSTHAEGVNSPQKGNCCDLFFASEMCSRFLASLTHSSHIPFYRFLGICLVAWPLDAVYLPSTCGKMTQLGGRPWLCIRSFSKGYIPLTPWTLPSQPHRLQH